MTIIAWDGLDLAADTLAVIGSERLAKEHQKIMWTPRKTALVGCSGVSGMLRKIASTVDEAQNPDNLMNFPLPYLHESHDDKRWSALVYYPALDKMFYVISASAQCLEVEAPFTIGHGADYAMGALHAGATAEGAVQIAMKLDVYCGGRVTVHETRKDYTND